MGRERFRAYPLTLVVGASVAIVAALVVPPRRHDLLVEMAKGGIQLFVVVVVGTAVAYAFRREESERDHRRRLDEYRRGVLLELVEAYNRIKEVRRTLRAYGFRSPRSDTQSADTLSADQSNEFQTQMPIYSTTKTISRTFRHS